MLLKFFEQAPIEKQTSRLFVFSVGGYLKNQGMERDNESRSLTRQWFWRRR